MAPLPPLPERLGSGGAGADGRMVGLPGAPRDRPAGVGARRAVGLPRARRSPTAPGRGRTGARPAPSAWAGPAVPVRLLPSVTPPRQALPASQCETDIAEQRWKTPLAEVLAGNNTCSKAKQKNCTPSVTIKYDSLPAAPNSLSTSFAIWSLGFNYNGAPLQLFKESAARNSQARLYDTRDPGHVAGNVLMITSAAREERWETRAGEVALSLIY
ncbi:uncharacterized protein LOC126648737 [Myiozetetes cayanensis]|uniref:uncharacterized protein LOC126648737 n=1 Tax=Myiozetetes cayanensis TaxID=478635 RepID=UPI00215F6712|nr:uncharacterized protein LOC126648737 [Myiozetetes cayanensis]